MTTATSSLKQMVDTGLPGLSRAYRRLRDFLYFKSLRPYRTSFGFSLYGDRDLDVSRTEQHEVEIFLNLLERSDAVVDIGANVGFFTCLAAQQDKRVLAFEPHPYNVQNLCRNLLMNDLQNVELFPIALSNAAGVAALFGGGQGATLIPGWCGIRSNYRSLTALNTLDNVLAHRFENQQILIKMDVEGNEFRLLEQARSVLARQPAPFWIVEHGLLENFGGQMNPHFEALFQLFWSHGYEARTVDSEQRVVLPEDVRRWIANQHRDFGSINYFFTRPTQTPCPTP